MLAMKTVQIYIGQYMLESIYSTAFLLACLAMALLGRWTARNLMLFMFVVAVLYVCCRTAHQLSHASPV